MMNTDWAHSALGTTGSVGSEQLTLLIPSKDREGRAIDQDFWTEEALGVLGRLFHGATAFPPGRGVWRDDERGGKLLWETTVIIFCFASKEDLGRNFPDLRSFLHRLGRETSQGEVGIVINHIYHKILRFDKA